MTQVLKLAALMAVIDSVYLLPNAGKFGEIFEKVQGRPLKLRMWVLVPLYLVMAYALLTYAPKGGSKWQAYLLGALVYGVYELTNYATLEEWPWQLVGLDIVWGAILFGMSHAIFNSKAPIRDAYEYLIR